MPSSGAQEAAPPSLHLILTQPEDGSLHCQASSQGGSQFQVGSGCSYTDKPCKAGAGKILPRVVRGWLGTPIFKHAKAHRQCPGRRVDQGSVEGVHAHGLLLGRHWQDLPQPGAAPQQLVDFDHRQRRHQFPQGPRQLPLQPPTLLNVDGIPEEAARAEIPSPGRQSQCVCTQLDRTLGSDTPHREWLDLRCR